MAINRIEFVAPEKDSLDLESLKDDVLSLVSLMRNNGQIVSDSDVCILEGNTVYIDVICPEVDSLAVKNSNIYISNLIGKVNLEYNTAFSYRTIDKSESVNGSLLYENAPFFILHWEYYSPLKSGSDFDPIPLYFFPYSYRDKNSYNDIGFWWNNYINIYRVWRSGEIDEQIFYSYLSDINNPLNMQGLKICRNLEGLVYKDCYYYLFHYGDTRQAPNCPSCGEEWELEVPFLSQFHFKCDRCKIISNE